MTRLFWGKGAKEEECHQWWRHNNIGWNGRHPGKKHHPSSSPKRHSSTFYLLHHHHHQHKTLEFVNFGCSFVVVAVYFSYFRRCTNIIRERRCRVVVAVAAEVVIFVEREQGLCSIFYHFFSTSRLNPEEEHHSAKEVPKLDCLAIRGIHTTISIWWLDSALHHCTW